MSSVLNKKVIMSCFLAGCLEMYDFVIFGFLTPIIRKNYLSFLDSNQGLIITYLLFAVGYIFRPIGSIIFGYIGDVYGRKKALVVSVSMMGISSLGMCLLPTYASLGLASCYLIAVMRIIQGMSVGGEYNGAMIYAVEHFNNHNLGKVCSLVLAGSSLGVLLATFVSKLLQNPLLPEYAWRFAFLLGFGLSIIGYFIRKKLTETPLFKKVKNNKVDIPLFYGLKNLRLEFLTSLLLSAANNTLFYYFLIFIPNYINSYGLQLNYNNLMMITILFICVPCFGYISDKIGRINMLLFICPVLGLYSYFILPIILNSNSYLILLHTSCIAILMASLVATVNIIVLEVFPTKCRFSCGSVSYSIGAAIGGVTPFICSLIIEYFTHNTWLLGGYILFVVSLGWMITILLYKKQSISNYSLQLNKA